MINLKLFLGLINGESLIKCRNTTIENFARCSQGIAKYD